MLHIIPTSHKDLLQEILKELIRARDPDAYFDELDPDPDPEPKVATIGA